MAFWSGEKLSQRLPSLISGYDASNIDCASYRLTVGDQVFATSDKFATSQPAEPIVSVLGDAPNHTLRIKPGQFAFLMTSESVRVPNDALALISMRAGYKFKGLINVSGFHVDPGWEGQLLFSVYNAGPAEVIIKRGEPMFLIVFADLDKESEMVYEGTSKGQRDINVSLLQNMTEQVFSPLMLQRKIEDLANEVRTIEGTATRWKAVTFAVSTGLGILLAGAAIFATFAPATLGVIVAKLIETGGYELKQKVDESKTDSTKLNDTNQQNIKNKK